MSLTLNTGVLLPAFQNAARHYFEELPPHAAI
ncbi:hypothetical protein SAMN05216230_11519 [Pseudomonas soli]|jgi:hypothetical protein|uniref:Uncharacterized protein n=1 Tax=Pseudomonas soli TaxID=1306993 RepID=A0A1H9TBL0_9PSED|nr:hypothetical protein SAMN05216230_11519 [Pseudomonas soli]